MGGRWTVRLRVKETAEIITSDHIFSPSRGHRSLFFYRKWGWMRGEESTETLAPRSPECICACSTCGYCARVSHARNWFKTLKGNSVICVRLIVVQQKGRLTKCVKEFRSALLRKTEIFSFCRVLYLSTFLYICSVSVEPQSFICNSPLRHILPFYQNTAGPVI